MRLTDDKASERIKVLVLFLCLAVNGTEQSGTMRNNADYVRTGHSKSHPFTKNTYYLCIVKTKCKTTMETKILKVVRQGEAFSVQSSKQESGQIQKCNIVLRELGGSKFENEFVCSMLGNLAGCRFYEGDVVVATLRFSTHEYQGQVFQEILATDIVKLGK